MDTKAVTKPAHICKRLLLLGILTCLPAIDNSGQPTRRPQVSVEAPMSKRIAKIISETLKKGELNIKGARVLTRTSPSKEAVEEIKRDGDDAVPILAGYLHSKSLRERDLALTLLGLLGGSRIIAPLREVIQSDPSPSFRLLALRWITQAPSNLAAPIIREAAAKDPDKHVREEAKNILTTFAPE